MGAARAWSFCLKREGHDGDHRGLRKQWSQNGRKKKITEKCPGT